MHSQVETITDDCYDIVVIGAGVVGCAIARRFALEGARVLVLEKAGDILDGASKGNSAILHTGFDEPSDFLERKCVQDGYREFMSIRERLNLPVLKTGGLVVAWNESDTQQLPDLLSRAYENGVEDAVLISTDELRRLEPHLSHKAIAGLRIPGECIIDPWSTPYAYLLQAIENGASVLRGAAVSGGTFDGKCWRLTTTRGLVNGTTVINAGGLYGDRIDSSLLGESGFEIRPRKGQFLVYDKVASRYLSSIILPVPNEIGKGVVVTKTIFGNVLVGPTAQEQESREDTRVDRSTLIELKRKAESLLPVLADCAVTATYAGLRPATESRDYCIRYSPKRHYATVGGIRSTGLSAALGIASYVYQQYTNAGHRHNRAQTVWPRVPMLAEHCTRAWEQPGNGGIVCHCELVTRREVHMALRGPLAATSLDALKRRTRVTMGRCQGFYCSAELSEITRGQFTNDIAIADIARHIA